MSALSGSYNDGAGELAGTEESGAALVADLAEAEGITLAEAARRLGAALTSDAPPLRITSEPDVAAPVASEPYRIGAPIPLSQVCLRCGAEVGSRSLHDAWHEQVSPGRTAELERQVTFLSSELHDARHALEDAQGESDV